MFVKFTGKCDSEDIKKHLDEVVVTMLQRCGVFNCKAWKIEDLQCKVNIQLEDDKWVYVSAVHQKEDGTGTYEEMLTVNVKLDSKGAIVTTVDTEYNPIIDETMQKFLDGTYEYSCIESEYSDDELEFIEELTGGDVRAIRYNDLSDNEFEVVRYYKEDTLVFEMDLKKEWQVQGQS